MCVYMYVLYSRALDELLNFVGKSAKKYIMYMDVRFKITRLGVWFDDFKTCYMQNICIFSIWLCDI